MSKNPNDPIESEGPALADPVSGEHDGGQIGEPLNDVIEHGSIADTNLLPPIDWSIC